MNRKNINKKPAAGIKPQEKDSGILKYILIIFTITFLLNITSLFRNKQLEFMDGMAEEYISLGVNLYYTGKFLPDSNGVFVFRPPAYPVFICSVLKIWGGMPAKDAKFKSKEEFDQIQQKAYKAVYFAQCLLLCLSSVLLFLWMRKYLSLINSLILSVLFGCNPYMIMLTGLLHYTILHTFLIIASCYLLFIASESTKKQNILLLTSGILWGLTTLVRPLSLILPFFILILFIFKYRFSWKPVLLKTAIFTIGMIITISPYTMRNYRLTHKIIPVNAQSYVALWVSTIENPERNPNYYKWWNMWYKDGMPVFNKVSDSTELSNTSWVTYNLKLEDEFKELAKKNFLEKPGIYFNNVFQNIMTFNTGINSVFIKIFKYIQEPGKIFTKQWLQVGNPQDFYPSKESNAFRAFINILMILSALGIYYAIRKKDKTILVAAMVYLCFCIAHSITYMDIMYYYLKMPFLFIFSGYFIKNLKPFKSKFNPANIINGFLIIFTAGLILAILF